MGCRASLDVVEKRKVSCSYRESNLDCPACSSLLYQPRSNFVINFFCKYLAHLVPVTGFSCRWVVSNYFTKKCLLFKLGPSQEVSTATKNVEENVWKCKTVPFVMHLKALFFILKFELQGKVEHFLGRVQTPVAYQRFCCRLTWYRVCYSLYFSRLFLLFLFSFMSLLMAIWLNSVGVYVSIFTTLPQLLRFCNFD